VITKLGRDISSRDQGCLAGGRLREPLDAKTCVQRAQGDPVIIERRGISRQRFPSDQVVKHGCVSARKWIYTWIVLAQANAVQKKKKKPHINQ
jgi:hypothetical protein